MPERNGDAYPALQMPVWAWIVGAVIMSGIILTAGLCWVLCLSQ